ncbi:MAG: hypothetical protein EKK54_08030 [Neisseriaceae bacterium]|nr:MAG: hypothetical protein EKK54_08030 [Neisseriaceae bacterium]
MGNHSFNNAVETIKTMVNKGELNLSAMEIVQLIQHGATREDISRLDNKIDKSVDKLDDKIDRSVDKLEAKINAVESRIEAKIDKLEAKMFTKKDFYIFGGIALIIFILTVCGLLYFATGKLAQLTELIKAIQK